MNTAIYAERYGDPESTQTGEESKQWVKVLLALWAEHTSTR